MKKRTAFLALVIVLIAITSFFLSRETRLNLSPSTAHPSPTAPVPVHPPGFDCHGCPPPTAPQSPSAATGISVTVPGFNTTNYYEIGPRLGASLKDYNNILRATKQDNAIGLKNYKVTYADKTWTLNGLVKIIRTVVYLGITNGPYKDYNLRPQGPYTLTFYAPS